MPSTTELRAERLQELAEECTEVYDETAREIVETACLDELRECPRYALLTAEPAHADNPNLTVHDDLGSVSRQVIGELSEEYPWHPVKVVDLDTGSELPFEVDHLFEIEGVKRSRHSTS